MSIETWILFTITETVLCASPGPAVLLVLSLTLTNGFSAGMKASAGIIASNIAYFLVYATGLGAILLASSQIFLLVKWIGAGYLIWLGLKMIFSKSDGALAEEEASLEVVREAESSSDVSMFWNGVIAQGANPKALFFFAALLPQFINLEGSVSRQMTILAITSLVVEFVVLVSYSGLAGRANHLARDSKLMIVFNRLGGSLIVIAGSLLAIFKGDVGLGLSLPDPPQPYVKSEDEIASSGIAIAPIRAATLSLGSFRN